MLTALARLEPVSIRGLSRAVELPVPIVASICGELRKTLRRLRAAPAQLTRQAAGCPQARPGSSAGPRVAVAQAPAREIADAAPPPAVELDQCHCTVDTKLRRVLALHAADALVGRRMLLLGDDDLGSLAIRLSSSASARTRRSRRDGARRRPAAAGLHPRRSSRARRFQSIRASTTSASRSARSCVAPSTRSSPTRRTRRGARLFLSRAAEASRTGRGTLAVSSARGDPARHSASSTRSRTWASSSARSSATSTSTWRRRARRDEPPVPPRGDAGAAAPRRRAVRRAALHG